MGERTPQSKGRETNEAEPPGQRPGLVSDKKTEAVGRHARRAAGPDGPDAAEVGDTFKRAH